MEPFFLGWLVGVLTVLAMEAHLRLRRPSRQRTLPMAPRETPVPDYLNLRLERASGQIVDVHTRLASAPQTYLHWHVRYDLSGRLEDGVYVYRERV